MQRVVRCCSIQNLTNAEQWHTQPGSCSLESTHISAFTVASERSGRRQAHWARLPDGSHVSASQALSTARLASAGVSSQQGRSGSDSVKTLSSTSCTSFDELPMCLLMLSNVGKPFHYSLTRYIQAFKLDADESGLGGGGRCRSQDERRHPHLRLTGPSRFSAYSFSSRKLLAALVQHRGPGLKALPFYFKRLTVCHKQSVKIHLAFSGLP